MSDILLVVISSVIGWCVGVFLYAFIKGLVPILREIREERKNR